MTNMKFFIMINKQDDSYFLFVCDKSTHIPTPQEVFLKVPYYGIPDECVTFEIPQEEFLRLHTKLLEAIFDIDMARTYSPNQGIMRTWEYWEGIDYTYSNGRTYSYRF